MTTLTTLDNGRYLVRNKRGQCVGMFRLYNEALRRYLAWK